ncbi:FixH family protein [Nitratiruptor sp. YY09-18]|uniref:FixH family protein n=1 Tax=Nitratiruptor sp. YY09-18 TaxID=2724901 RepID=UPI001915236E|nr:FixH family protein [Nitratiruptor sp. YY09-18]BCD68740.1 hypothetical protein NitYY0918_C1657 [Nitratiruptor sp. YY09-18]
MTSKNYWPHFIIGLVLFAIAMGVWTVKTAIDNPVELDNSYMMKYQDVDKDIYDILKMQKEFNKNYKFIPLTKKLGFPDAAFAFKIVDKNGNVLKDAQAIVLFTRPETTKYDIKTKAVFQDGEYIAKAKLPLKGRWNIIVKLNVDKLTVFEKYKMSTLRDMLVKA